MVAITQSTLINSIWRNFRDRIVSQVTSVTLSISPGSQTIQTYASSYSDVTFGSKEDLPILVINSPRVPQKQITLSKTKVNGTIEIEVYATNSQAADKFLDAINNAIETYKHEFADLGLHNLECEETDDDFLSQGDFNVHLRITRWKFDYKFNRTRAY